MPLMFASTVSVVCQVRVEDWPQLMFAVEELKLPVAGATAICALAMPALNRGTSLSFSPRVQSTVFCVPLVHVNDDFLVRDHGHIAGPYILALVRHGEVVRARRQQQILVPDPVEVHFVHVPDEISGRRAVGKDRGALIALQIPRRQTGR